jgi:hypothetical protein
MADKVTEAEDRGISDGVKSIQPVSPAADQASLRKRLQMLGYIRLAGTKLLDNAVD